MVLRLSLLLLAPLVLALSPADIGGCCREPQSWVQLNLEGAGLGETGTVSGLVNYKVFAKVPPAGELDHWQIICGADHTELLTGPMEGADCSSSICIDEGTFPYIGHDWCFLRIFDSANAVKVETTRVKLQ